MDSISLSSHHDQYHLKGCQYFQMLVPGCSPFAQRHWEISQQKETTHPLIHKTIAIAESIPLLGALIALIERVIAKCFPAEKNTVRQPTTSVQTHIQHHQVHDQTSSIFSKESLTHEELNSLSNHEFTDFSLLQQFDNLRDLTLNYSPAIWSHISIVGSQGHPHLRSVTVRDGYETFKAYFAYPKIDNVETQEMIKAAFEKLQSKPFFNTWLGVVHLDNKQAREFLCQAPFKGGTCAGQSLYFLQRMRTDFNSDPVQLIQSADLQTILYNQMLCMVIENLKEPFGPGVAQNVVDSAIDRKNPYAIAASLALNKAQQEKLQDLSSCVPQTFNSSMGLRTILEQCTNQLGFRMIAGIVHTKGHDLFVQCSAGQYIFYCAGRGYYQFTNRELFIEKFIDFLKLHKTPIEFEIYDVSNL